MKTIHIYAQDEWHDTAFIVGTEESLLALAEQIKSAVQVGLSVTEHFTCDGECFDLIVCREEDLDKMRLPYTSPLAADVTINGIHPHGLEKVKAFYAADVIS